VTAPTKGEVVTRQRIPPVKTQAHEHNAGMTWRDINETMQKHLECRRTRGTAAIE
jgi:hypothetical protein